jgi:flavin-binding protein dodecin
MEDHVYKTIDITGTSTASYQAAIENGITRANETIRNIRWFEVAATRGTVDKGRITRWQVTMRVSFTLDG